MEILYLYIIGACACFNQTSSWTTWSPEWLPHRHDLLCDDTCFDKYRPLVSIGYRSHEHTCCVCNSTTTWLQDDVLEDLYIEYNTASGGSIVQRGEKTSTDMDTLVEETNTALYRLLYTYDVMSSLPSNICAIGNIKIIILAANRIITLKGIECVYHLDTLDLSYNSIRYVSRDTFTKLTYLRHVSLDNNEIETIEPRAFLEEHLMVFHISLAYNRLKTMDVSNIFQPNPVCQLNLQNNEIEKFVNAESITFDINKTYGPANYRLNHNKLKDFPNYLDLIGISDVSQLGAFMSKSFELTGNSLDCSCSVEPFLKFTKALIPAWRTGGRLFTCSSPEQFKDKSVLDVPRELLICPLDTSKNCSIDCTCIDDPYNNRILINCSNVGIKYLPDRVPNSAYSEYIDMYARNNIIETIDNNISYLTRIRTLDLSNNLINHLNKDVSYLLQNANVVILKNNPLKQIPETLSFRNVCSFNIADVILECTCESLWISKWAGSSHCEWGSFYCHVKEHDVMLAQDFKADYLECKTEITVFTTWVYALTGVIGGLILIFLLFSYFRYEISISFKRMYGKHIFLNGNNIDLFAYDAFISIDENNEDVLNYINKLVRTLELDGYTIFLAYRDIQFGSVRDLEIISGIKQSRTFLIVLSESYLCPEVEALLVNNDWKYAWNAWESYLIKDIVVINFDHIESDTIRNMQIRAYLRVGNVIQFYNNNRDIYKRIKSSIGPSIEKGNADEITRFNIDRFRAERVDDRNEQFQERHKPFKNIVTVIELDDDIDATPHKTIAKDDYRNLNRPHISARYSKNGMTLISGILEKHIGKHNRLSPNETCTSVGSRNVHKPDNSVRSQTATKAINALDF